MARRISQRSLSDEGFVDDSEEEESTQASAAKEAEEAEQEPTEEEPPVLANEHLDKSVEELELSVRSYNCLKNAEIRTIRELVQKTEPEMLRTKNFGRKSLNEIKEILVEMGLHLGMRFDEPSGPAPVQAE